jgi:hypothetical protein
MRVAADRAAPGGRTASGTIAGTAATTAAAVRFRVTNRIGDGIPRRIRSSPGLRDRLVAGDDAVMPGPSGSLLNGAFPRAEAQPGQKPFDPPAGYACRILEAQGSNKAGGARFCLTNGWLTEGYAALASPKGSGSRPSPWMIKMRSPSASSAAAPWRKRSDNDLRTRAGWRRVQEGEP